MEASSETNSEAEDEASNEMKSLVPDETCAATGSSEELERKRRKQVEENNPR